MAKQYKLSNMMQHYLSQKEKYPECFLFYRLGDFYEMFFDDAIEASKLLDITLTGRDCGLEERAPMCGVPYHAVDSYIAKLVSLGKKVAICEQLTEPGDQKGLVERDVVRVVSNGTMIEDGELKSTENNFLCSIYFGVSKNAIAWADITTGDFLVEEIADNEGIIDAISRINPAEIIANDKAYEYYLTLNEGLKCSLGQFNKYKEQAFNLSNAKDILLDSFEVSTLDCFISEDKVYAISAAGGLMSYLRETQMRAIKNITSLSYFDDGKFMILDAIAQKNLELTSTIKDGKNYGTLYWAINYTKTSGGARKLKDVLLTPLRDKDSMNYRLNGVTDLFKNNRVREQIGDILSDIKDLERLCGRLSNNILRPRDCIAIKQTLACIPSIRMSLLGSEAQIIKDILLGLGDFEDTVSLIDRMIVEKKTDKEDDDSNYIKYGFDETLDNLRKIRTNATDFIKEIEAREREKTGIKTLKIHFNKIFGYYIEVTKSFVSLVPYDYERKQTLVGAERYTTPELKKFEEDFLTSNEKIIKLQSELFNKLKDYLTAKLKEMLKSAKCFSMLDVLYSFATVSKKKNYVLPEILDSGECLDIVGGRHPIVESVSKDSFIPNDTLLDNNENRMLIITGPNMAGKSTYMRQVALITVLAQIGCYVPAKSARIPIVDRIFTRVGASDNLIMNQSTFMVEMTEVASIIRNSTKDSLLILDEVGRGTSTYDGLSIAWAVVEYLASVVKAKTLFATHYHELTELENTIEGVKNYKILVKEFDGKVIFLRKIARGSVNRSFGIEVASLAGVPDEVTNRAKSILKLLEKQDITHNKKSDEPCEEVTIDSKIKDFMKTIDLNNVTPLKAFELLTFIKEMCDEN